MNYSTFVKNTLLEKVHDMAEYQWLFVQNVEKDFTRKRKLDFKTMLQLFLTMESGSLKTQLFEFFHYSLDSATVSAFNQQREKLLPDALLFLFHEFNQAFQDYQTYDGYRLAACDGTDLNIAHNPQDMTTYFPPRQHCKGFNQLHLNAIYDLCSRRFIDIEIQPGRQMNACKAMANLIDEIKVHPELYKFIPHTSTFDYLEPKDKKFYPISFRIVRFPIAEHTYECIITNLDRENFSSEKSGNSTN